MLGHHVRLGLGLANPNPNPNPCQVMLGHHVGFALTALAVTQTCNTYYALCFFGVVELSSIPLCFADVFHPRRKVLYAP